MAELSPAAQAVLAAYNRDARPEPHHQCEAIAAALRAVVEATKSRQYLDCYICNASAICAIATELENING